MKYYDGGEFLCYCTEIGYLVFHNSFYSKDELETIDVLIESKDISNLLIAKSMIESKHFKYNFT